MPAALALPTLVVAPTAPSVEAPLVTDGELLVRVAQRDRPAFEELYARYARPVFGLALRRIADRGRAEDAVQETFASVWRSARRYDPARGPGGAWLYVVARNTIVDILRKTPEAAASDAPEIPSPDPGPSEEAERGWTAWVVHRALALLPENERSVIELAYWGGLSQSEVAAYLDIPLGTVKTRTRAALARLATALEEDLA